MGVSVFPVRDFGQRQFGDKRRSIVCAAGEQVLQQPQDAPPVISWNFADVRGSSWNIGKSLPLLRKKIVTGKMTVALQRLKNVVTSGEKKISHYILMLHEHP